MDMKRILEKLDQVSTKPAVDSNDMKKFVSIVSEGANPHKVALPVQMAMQHYQEVATEKTPIKESLFKQYFAEAEQVAEQKAVEKKQELNMYAHRIAKKVLEGHKDDAYTKDYKSSTSGFGRKDSLAYQLDGGANDEGWDEEESRPFRQYKKYSPNDNKSKQNTKEGMLGDIKDAVVGKSAEQWAQVSPQMAALLKMKAQYPNSSELSQRIDNHKMRLELGKGEVMGTDGKPIIPQPPKQ